MKKVYINPTTDIVNIEMAQMIAASGEKLEISNSETVEDASVAESHSSSIWDDDEF